MINNPNYNPPFTELYVAVIGADKRVYKKIAQAKALVSSKVNKDTEKFLYDCEIWIVGDKGWELFFTAQKGDHQSVIFWDNSFQREKTKREAREAEKICEEELRAFEAYKSLKKRFEGE